MKKKYIKTLSTALLLAVPVLCCTDAMAWEYYRFPWANVGRTADYDNLNGDLIGCPLTGATGDPIFDSSVVSGADNPIWNESEVFETGGWSWYDALNFEFHWKLAISNVNAQDCTFVSNRLYLRLFTADGTRVTEDTMVESAPTINLINSSLSNSTIRWNNATDQFELAVPAGHIGIVSSREILNPVIFGDNPTAFGFHHLSLQLVTENLEFDTLLTGEIDSNIRLESTGDGRDGQNAQHQWSMIQYPGFSSLDRISGNEWMFLPHFQTKIDKTNARVGYATMIFLQNPHPTQQSYTLQMYDKTGLQYGSNHTVTLNSYETTHLLASQFLPVALTEAEGSIHITGEQPAALAVNFRFAYNTGSSVPERLNSTLHALPFKFIDPYGATN